MPAVMTKDDAVADRALKALMELDGESTPLSAAHDHDSSKPPLPSLDERVDMFLRAVHGSESSFTAGQKARARDRILNTMAADVAGDLSDFEISQAAGGADATAKTIGAKTIFAQGNGQKKRGFGSLFYGMLLLLMAPLSAGRPMGMRLVAASLITMFVAGTGWSGAWYLAARSAETAVASWIDGEAKAGRSYECGSRNLRGFPTHVELSCIDPKATVALGPSTVVVNAKALRATASILQPDVLTTEITGPLSISEPGKPGQYLGNWTLAKSVVHNVSSNPTQISFAVDDLQLYRASQINMEPVLASGRLRFDARVHPTGPGESRTFDIAAQIGEGSIANGGPILSQPFAANVSAELRNAGGTASESLTARLRQWQANGGLVDIKAARIQQGDAVATASGNLGLNKLGLVDGALLTAVTGTYRQLAQTYTGGRQPGQTDRERLANSLPEGSSVQSRSIGNIQKSERELRNEAGRQGQAPSVDQSNAPGGHANLPAGLSPPSLPKDGSFELPISIVNGAIYFGTTLVAVIPPLF